MKKILITTLIVFIAFAGHAKVRLPKIFGDSMILQRNQPIPVWGWADKNEKITVQFNKQSKTTKAGKDGKWKINLEPEKAGGPFNLTVKGKNTITIKNVLVGEVWVCSGQSNMEWPVSASNNAAKEIRQANYPQIRHFLVQKDVAVTPKEDIKGNSAWEAATPANVGDFTAVGYFFARNLYKELNIPIGLIHTSWGGTDVETWISREAFENADEFKEMISAMPQVSLDSLAKEKAKALLTKIESLQNALPTASEAQSWKEAAFDDSQWPKMRAPGLWETQRLSNLDGVVWLRKTINITSTDAGKSAVLNLAMIDDADETYLNGVKIGSTNQYNAKRSYNIPAGILKEGKNVIAIRVTDTGGGGGIHGDALDMNLTIDSKSESLAGEWSFKVESIASGATSISPNLYPTLLYNAMIHPLIPYGIKGAIWYQGENNAGRAYQYRKAFPLMINDWRKHWGQGDFPFYFVQLTSFNQAGGNSNKGSSWAELREAQAMTLDLPNTGMAVITDIGDPSDIHPRNKQDVGKRLAAIALKNAYDKNIIAGGPTFDSFRIEGNKAILSFKNTGSGLMTNDKYGYVKGFEIAGEDKKFHYAKASIVGNQMVLQSENVEKPIAIRYAWADDASDANLFNKEGFPAAPFRTDEWKGITEEAKYGISK
ncbi:MAG TPA: sialate O-acetylesterase [Cytophagales bacterium]|nr:sialate O-acetylesterase [Cytophagales bacterium]